MGYLVDFAFFVAGAALASPVAYYFGKKYKIAQTIQADTKTEIKAVDTADKAEGQIGDEAQAEEAKIPGETPEQVIADIEKE